MTGTFKGRLTAVYIESNGGRTVNVLSRTEKEARLGILYNRHGPVYYLPTHHEIVAIFDTKVIYFENGKKVEKHHNKHVYLRLFGENLTEKRALSFEYLAPVANAVLDNYFHTTYEFDLKKIASPYNKKPVWSVATDSWNDFLMQLYGDIRSYIKTNHTTLASMQEKDDLCKRWMNYFLEYYQVSEKRRLLLEQLRPYN